MKTRIKRLLPKDSIIYLILKKIYFIYRKIKFHITILISIPFLIIPIKNKKIVISNYFGKGYGDNGKYIVEEIVKQGLDYDIVWLVRKSLFNNVSLPPFVRKVKYGTIRSLYELSTAKIWIDNCRKAFHPIKRKNQFYIQTWHGGISLKRIEKDAQNSLNPEYVKMAKRDSKMIDLMVSNSEFCTKMYRNAFWYDGEILEIGSPRCDIFFKDKSLIINKVKKYYEINEEDKILLYAPTFRKDENIDVYNIDFNNLIKILEKRFKSKWVILIRFHPNISEMSNFIKYSSNIIDTTNYEDMYELLAASDILITDYSSTMFEFSFMKKPVFLYTPDLEDYKNDRDFYFDLEELPYPISKNNIQLQLQIMNYDEIDYLKKLDSFLTKLNIFENGQASRILANKIKQII